jgi:hypothetical protein
VVIKQVGGGKLGNTKSKKKGAWTFNVGGPAEPGDYFAKVKKNGDNKIVCKKGRSPAISVS